MTNKRKEAIALHYNRDQMDAPVVIGKGKGTIADKILLQAKEHNIPIQKDSSLVELLSSLNLNDKIPEELYHAVAEVFAFIYQADKKAGQQ